MTKPSKFNRIESAAVRIGGPNGRIFIGRDHSSILDKIKRTTDTRPVIGEMGFVDTRGEFLDRKAAMKIAVEAGQVKEPMDPKELCSQDIIGGLKDE